MAVHKLSILVEAIGAEKAAKGLKGVDATIGSIGARTGTGLRALGSNLKSLAGAAVGVLGVGGLFSLGAAFEKGVTKAQEFGGEVKRLMALTGQSAETVSGMAAVLEHFGIGADSATKAIGMMEKNLGLLASKKDGVSKFEKQFGLDVTNANGHLKSANDLLLTASDYFLNKHIPATQKAAAMSKLFGRSWQDLIPYLSAGRAKIAAAAEEAKRLGMTLTGPDIENLAKLKEATRTWGDALGGLEMQIGLKLLPRITDLATAATSFVEGHGKEIVGFFDDAAKFAGQVGGAITTYVVPGIQKIAGAWAAVPDDLKKLLIGGFVANKLTGGMLSGIAGDLGKLGLKQALGVLGIKAGVVNVSGAVVKTPGGVPGLPGGAAGAGAGAAETAGGAGLAATAAGALSVTALGAAIGYAMFYAIPKLVGTPGPGESNSLKVTGSTGQSLGTLNGPYASMMNAYGGIGNQLAKANALTLVPPIVDLAKATRDSGYEVDNAVRQAWKPLAKPLDALHQDFVKQLGILKKTADPAAAARAAAKAAADVKKGLGSVDTTKALLATLLKDRRLVKGSGDSKLLAQIDAAILSVRGKIAPREWVAGQLQSARRIAASGESTKQKLADLKQIEGQLKARGDTNAARQVAAIRTNASTVSGAVKATGKPTVNVTTNVSVTAGGIRRTVSVSARYGSQVGSYGGGHGTGGGNRT